MGYQASKGENTETSVTWQLLAQHVLGEHRFFWIEKDDAGDSCSGCDMEMLGAGLIDVQELFAVGTASGIQ